MQELPLAIDLKQVGKRHGRQWVLRKVDLEVTAGSIQAILGANGSGKSSLLRIMCAFDRPSEGGLTWNLGGRAISAMDVPTQMAYCAPDQGLIADLEVAEHIALHQRLRRSITGTTHQQVLELALLSDKGAVRVSDLSSGMRQRLALALAFTTDASALFLDEPTSHLDKAGKAWYQSLVADWRRGRTLVVASNHDTTEYPGANSVWEFAQS
ncbi:MAG: ATP-binding cassette domain-containing protein [Flavobacteriales bacterium]|nr:ATP-binding cassette domain-containing protein [Flavobacteriales bacterium]